MDDSGRSDLIYATSPANFLLRRWLYFTAGVEKVRSAHIELTYYCFLIEGYLPTFTTRPFSCVHEQLVTGFWRPSIGQSTTKTKKKGFLTLDIGCTNPPLSGEPSPRSKNTPSRRCDRINQGNCQRWGPKRARFPTSTADGQNHVLGLRPPNGVNFLFGINQLSHSHAGLGVSVKRKAWKGYVRLGFHCSTAVGPMGQDKLFCRRRNARQNTPSEGKASLASRR